MQLTQNPELRRVELRHRPGGRPADVIGKIEVDVVQEQLEPGAGLRHPPVEVLGDHDDRRHPLLPQGSLRLAPAHHAELVGLAVGLDQVGHPGGERSLVLDDQRHRLLANRRRQDRDKEPHRQRRQERSRHRRRRAAPDRQVVAGDPPERAHHRRRPPPSATLAAKRLRPANASRMSRSTSTGSGVTCNPWNAHSSTPTA